MRSALTARLAGGQREAVVGRRGDGGGGHGDVVQPLLVLVLGGDFLEAKKSDPFCQTLTRTIWAV